MRQSGCWQRTDWCGRTAHDVAVRDALRDAELGLQFGQKGQKSCRLRAVKKKLCMVKKVFRLEIDRSLRPCSSWIVMFIYIILHTSERVWGWEGSGLWFGIEASHNKRAG